MVALFLVATTREIFLGVVAILILVMGTFGLDGILFSKKKKAGRDPRAPKKRISYVVKQIPDEDTQEANRR